MNAVANPVAPAVFIGVQNFGHGITVELFNLTADIAGHPVESTVSRQTLESAGYFVPANPSKS